MTETLFEILFDDVFIQHQKVRELQCKVQSLTADQSELNEAYKLFNTKVKMLVLCDFNRVTFQPDRKKGHKHLLIGKVIGFGFKFRIPSKILDGINIKVEKKMNAMNTILVFSQTGTHNITYHLRGNLVLKTPKGEISLPSSIFRYEMFLGIEGATFNDKRYGKRDQFGPANAIDTEGSVPLKQAALRLSRYMRREQLLKLFFIEDLPEDHPQLELFRKYNPKLEILWIEKVEYASSDHSLYTEAWIGEPNGEYSVQFIDVSMSSITIEEAWTIADVRERNIAYGQIFIAEGERSFEGESEVGKAIRLRKIFLMKEPEKRAVFFAQQMDLNITLVIHEVGASGHGFYFGYNSLSRFQETPEEYIKFVCRMVGELLPDYQAVEKMARWIWRGF